MAVRLDESWPEQSPVTRWTQAFRGCLAPSEQPYGFTASGATWRVARELFAHGNGPETYHADTHGYGDGIVDQHVFRI